MHITQTIVAALFAASTALAAPAVADKSMMASSSSQWTIESMKRVCAKDDSSCTFTFAINTHSGSATGCKMVAKGPHASEHAGGPANCGDYTVTSGWSGQFGKDKGFTTLAVVNNKSKMIVFPAYTDKELDPAKVVSPNKSYTPQHI